MKKIQAVSVAIGITTLSTLAFAHGGKGKMDTDGDGKVTLAEALAGSKQRFERMDKNKNGVVTKDEVQGRGQRFIERADANKDGQVTLAESEAKARAWFQKADANKDGVLAGDELHHGRHGKDKKSQS